MKIQLLLLAGLLSNLMLNAQNDTILDMFRTTYVGTKAKNEIRLQNNIESLKSIAVNDGLNKYHLKKGSYGVADSIWIETNDQKLIKSVGFLYDYDTAYVHELTKYQRVMNNPGKQYIYYSLEKKISVTKWENKSTRFELVEVTDKGKHQTYSVIFDNELNFKDLLSSIDLSKNDDSIELLRLLGLIGGQ